MTECSRDEMCPDRSQLSYKPKDSTPRRTFLLGDDEMAFAGCSRGVWLGSFTSVGKEVRVEPTIAKPGTFVFTTHNEGETGYACVWRNCELQALHIEVVATKL